MSSMQPLLLPVRASGREGGSAWACALIASGDDEARPRSAACVNHRLDDIADYSMAQRRGGAADLEFSHEEALECCAWMTPDLFARVAYRRRLDAAFDAYDEAPPSELSSLVSRLNGVCDGKVQDDGLGDEEAPADFEFSHEEAHSTDGGSSCVESEPGDDWRLEAAWYAYGEAPPDELSCLVYRLNGLCDGKVQDDGLGDEEAFSQEAAQPLPTAASVSAFLGRCPPPGFGALCASSCEELYAKYSLHL
mmetsp:Transcript_63441/g.175469  ORF Transcript_63441/g.175469 Transcript_63441/m.175469 type:complete len:250 (-) Transcript_63441:296-1045(-)